MGFLTVDKIGQSGCDYRVCFHRKAADMVCMSLNWGIIASCVSAVAAVIALFVSFRIG